MSTPKTRTSALNVLVSGFRATLANSATIQSRFSILSMTRRLAVWLHWSSAILPALLQTLYPSQLGPRALLDALADAGYACHEITSMMRASTLSVDAALTRPCVPGGPRVRERRREPYLEACLLECTGDELLLLLVPTSILLLPRPSTAISSSASSPPHIPDRRFSSPSDLLLICGATILPALFLHTTSVPHLAGEQGGEEELLLLGSALSAALLRWMGRG
ncbi:hypothetical protein DFH06DRAFT_1465815 [Mycena polygramma]|nr:hypothetical protein DFH06DRAFT_1465815 [Mycena polygramma]